MKITNLETSCCKQIHSFGTLDPDLKRDKLKDVVRQDFKKDIFILMRKLSKTITSLKKYVHVYLRNILHIYIHISIFRCCECFSFYILRFKTFPNASINYKNDMWLLHNKSRSTNHIYKSCCWTYNITAAISFLIMQYLMWKRKKF